MSLIFTELAADTFQRPNETPLQHPPWSLDTFGDPGLAIVSHLCQSSSDSVSSVEVYTGIAWPNDQYFDITIHTMGGDGQSLIVGYLRTQADFFDNPVGYECGCNGVIGGDPSLNEVYIQAFPSGDVVMEVNPVSLSQGDVFRYACIGSTFYIFQNGVQIGTGTNSEAASGSSMLAIGSFDTPAATCQISKWAGGRVSDSNAGSGNSSWLSVAANNVLRGSRSH